MEWFRCYSEIINDPKINYVAESTGYSINEVRGMIMSIFCLASESPIRGKLMLTSTIAMPLRNISETFRVTDDVTNKMLHAFKSVEMMEQDGNGNWCITNWNKRQYESDSSTKRVQKHRENKKKETLPERPCNVSETPQIQSTDTDINTSSTTTSIVIHDEPEESITERQTKFKLCSYFSDLNGGRYPTQNDIAIERELRKHPNFKELQALAVMEQVHADAKERNGEKWNAHSLGFYKDAIIRDCEGRGKQNSRSTAQLERGLREQGLIRYEEFGKVVWLDKMTRGTLKSLMDTGQRKAVFDDYCSSHPDRTFEPAGVVNA
jgi:hypothetical protein